MKQELRQAYETYMREEPDFQAGEMVEWKPGMRGVRHKGPFIFMNRSPDGESLFCTLLDDGTFYFVEIDPRRLQRVVEK